jgi:stage V sporulation protein S
MGLLKVSSRSNPNAVAGAFAGVIRERGRVEVQVVGAGALNQAIKAVAIARSMLGPQGFDLVCIPAFAEIEIDGEPRTAMQLVIERRSPMALRDVDDLRVEKSAGDVVVETTGTPSSGDIDTTVDPLAPVPPGPAI